MTIGVLTYCEYNDWNILDVSMFLIQRANHQSLNKRKIFSIIEILHKHMINHKIKI